MQIYANCQKSFNHVSGKKRDVDLFCKKGSVDEKKKKSNNKSYLKSTLQGYNQHAKNENVLGDMKVSKDYMKSKRKYNSVHTPNVNYSPNKQNQNSNIDSLNDKRLKVASITT